MPNVRRLSKELQQKAIEELNEDVSRIPQDIQAIKDWLNLQKYIKARTDDQTILSFLRGCKFSLERTKEKIETFYTNHTLITEILRNRNPFNDEIQDILKLGAFLPLLKQKELTAPRIIIANIASFNATKTNKDTLMKTFMMIMDILLNEDDQAIVGGFQLIVEFEGMTLQHLIPPALMVKAEQYIEKAIPSRFKGLHMMNMPSFFEAAFNIVKSFMSEKVKARIFMHNKNNLSGFHKVVCKDDLPKKFGGNGPDLEELRDYWKEKVESYAEWFKEGEEYGTDELQRPGRPKTTRELFGIEGVDGSFRNLHID